MATKTVFAEIESLEKEELSGMLAYIAEHILLKPLPDLKRELGMGRDHAPSGKHLIEVVRKYNLKFTLRIRHEKVISTKEERAEAQKQETPDLNATLKQPNFISEMNNQFGQIRNPDLKAMNFDPSPQAPVAQEPPPALPNINL